MTDIAKVSGAVALVALVVIGAYILGTGVQRTFAAAPSGLIATIASSSIAIVTAGSTNTLIGTTTCTSRIITTGGSPVKLTFSDYAGQVPTVTFGDFQNSSTTVAYDAEIYGCGRIRAYSFQAQNLTVTSVR